MERSSTLNPRFEDFKILGQADLDATTLTDLYTVPTGKSAIINAIFVCNRAGAAATFRISISVDGAADGVGQYLYYDVSVAANDTFLIEVPIPLDAADVIRGYASATTVTMVVVGTELK